MNAELAKQLIQNYVNGWKENNTEKIVACLAKDCVIIESHGPTYHGTDQIREWVVSWIKEEGIVNRWDITSFYFLEKESVAFFEWDFECRVRNKDHHLLGMSIAKIKDGRISFLHEYRMTKLPYEWDSIESRAE